MYSDKLNRLLGTHTPIICAPMAGASGGALASAVTLGGGFGFFGASYSSPEKLRTELSIARSAFPADRSNQLPIGVGFLCWRLELENSPELELLSITLDHDVKAVWFAFGNEIGRWVNLIRDHDRKTGNKNKTIVFVLVSSVEEARVAIDDWKVDVLVAQGIEAGGHGNSSAPPLLSLIPAIAKRLSDDDPLLIAAGGLSQGEHVASVLTLGASGAALGTRFLLSPESLYSDKQKQALIDANSTIRTTAFDRVRGTTGWPNGVDGRGLYNLTVEEYEKGVCLEEVRSKYSPDDPDRMVVWAGTGVSLMTAIKPAKEIVRELHQESVWFIQMVWSYVTEASELPSVL